MFLAGYGGEMENADGSNYGALDKITKYYKGARVSITFRVSISHFNKN
jgi:hypothetical protein